MPAAHAWVDAEDVWLGAPALAGHVAAADWRIEIEPVDATALDALTAAAAALASARTIPRVRTKGTEQKAYDLRPLLGEVGVESERRSVVVVARTRFHPELGAGRPEEVVAALAEAAGVPARDRGDDPQPTAAGRRARRRPASLTRHGRPGSRTHGSD